jgi:adenylate cyclase class 2
MALEIEIKYLDIDHSDLRKRLAALGAQYLNRGFESNIVFDDAARSLKAKGTLLRLREKDRRYVLTLKCDSGQSTSSAKVYDESETEILHAPSLHEILGGLGFAPVLHYEKLREKWFFQGCEVCLYLLPFGSFVEIEGGEAEIAACAKALELPQDKASTATYHDLNRMSRLAKGLAPNESFVFDDEAKATILARRATD